MKGSLGDKQRFQHILDSILKIERFIEGAQETDYLNNDMMQPAVERQLEIIGEASAQVSEELKESLNEIEGFKIKAFRNIIAHEYFGVSGKQVW